MNGVWVAGLAKCDVDSPSCNRVILNVTKEGNRLKVIEVTSDEAGTSVAERQYVFKGQLRRVGQGAGSAKAAGRRTVLRCSDRFERWSISADRSELMVNRPIGLDPKGPKRVLFFRRSEGWRNSPCDFLTEAPHCDGIKTKHPDYCLEFDQRTVKPPMIRLAAKLL
ncbi:MAG TPA: hypothetical protein VGZ73_00125, partial [Bryobacteraceae bacterium]|nr:hypothetical protein [Bryobacteraceae bacterium]